MKIHSCLWQISLWQRRIHISQPMMSYTDSSFSIFKNSKKNNQTSNYFYFVVWFPHHPKIVDDLAPRGPYQTYHPNLIPDLAPGPQSRYGPQGPPARSSPVWLGLGRSNSDPQNVVSRSRTKENTKKRRFLNHFGRKSQKVDRFLHNFGNLYSILMYKYITNLVKHDTHVINIQK